MMGCMDDSLNDASLIHTTWTRITDLLPEDAVNGPTSEEAVRALEAHIGSELPAQLRESVLLHDGTTDSNASFDAFGGWLLSVDEMQAVWDMWVEVSESVETGFHNSWVPVTADGAGNNYCVDVETGAVIDMDHEVGPNESYASSWVEFLEKQLDR